MPWRFRLDASYTTPFKLYAGLTFYLQSGAPLNKQGYFNAGTAPRSSSSSAAPPRRLPELYEMNLTLGYPLALGPVTITPQIYMFNLLNKQQVTLKDVRYSTSQPAGYTDCCGVTYPVALLALRPEPAADQCELQHVHGTPGAAPVPVCAEGLLLGRAIVSEFEGAAAAAPFSSSVTGGMILSSRRFPCVASPPPS